MMKKIYPVVCAMMLMVGLASCKKDSTGNDVAIVGKWHPKKEHDIYYKNNAIESEYIRDDYAPTDYLILNADGTGEASDTGAGTYTFTYKIKGNVINFKDDDGKPLGAPNTTLLNVTDAGFTFHDDIPKTVEGKDTFYGTIDLDYVKF
jgi:hypothetical protein